MLLISERRNYYECFPAKHANRLKQEVIAVTKLCRGHLGYSFNFLFVSQFKWTGAGKMLCDWLLSSFTSSHTRLYFSRWFTTNVKKMPDQEKGVLRALYPTLYKKDVDPWMTLVRGNLERICIPHKNFDPIIGGNFDPLH